MTAVMLCDGCKADLTGNLSSRASEHAERPCDVCGASHCRLQTHQVPTSELRVGQRVVVTTHRGDTVRIVAGVSDSGYVNRYDEPILNVTYEPDPSVQWSDGNSSNASGTWTVLP